MHCGATARRPWFGEGFDYLFDCRTDGNININSSLRDIDTDTDSNSDRIVRMGCGVPAL